MAGRGGKHDGCGPRSRATSAPRGRFNTFEFNTPMHQVYDPQKDNLSERRPMPTNRSGHGLVVLKERFWAMGGGSILTSTHEAFRPG